VDIFATTNGLPERGELVFSPNKFKIVHFCSLSTATAVAGIDYLSRGHTMGPPRMSETQEDSGHQTDAPPECTFAEFFESKPANLTFRITDVTPRTARTGPSSVPMMVRPSATFKVPPIRLWCNSDQCDGIRIFDPGHSDETLRISESDAKLNARFVSFSCRNCRHAWRHYAVLYGYSSDRKKLTSPKSENTRPFRYKFLRGLENW
jgi:hypothetical protein